MLARNDMVKFMSKVFKALSDPNRLRIIRMLASNMEEKLCVKDLADKLGISRPAASQQISVLDNIGILDRQKEGNQVYYYINAEALADIKKKIDTMFHLAFEKCKFYGKCKGHVD